MGRCESGVGGIDGAGESDGAGGVFDDQGFEAELLAVNGGEADAEVVGQTAEEKAVEAALAEVAGEAGGRFMVVFEEGGVTVDVLPEALSQNEFHMGDIERGVERGAFGVLETVVGPEGLSAVGNGYRLERLGARMGGCEGDVAGGVPVLGKNDVVEATREGINGGYDLVCAGDCQAPSPSCDRRAKVILEVDDEKGVLGSENYRRDRYWHM